MKNMVVVKGVNWRGDIEQDVFWFSDVGRMGGKVVFVAFDEPETAEKFLNLAKMGNLNVSSVFVKFAGVDSYNRPVFMSDCGEFYGSTENLFSEGAGEDEVLESITESDLVYFGNSFGCEPMGTVPGCVLEIVRSCGKTVN